MARFLAGSSLFAILALFATGLAGAQVNPGTPSFSAYDSHQYDTVNLQNLSVSLNIPVMSKNGAFPFNAALTGGDSYISFKGGTLQPGILATPLTPSINGVLSPFGYAQVLPAATTTVTCPSGDGDGSAYEYKSWYLQFPDGTVHSLPATDIVYGGASCSTTLTDQVIDGSGWTLTINGGLFYSSSQAGVTIVSSAGAIISSGENSTSVQDTQPTPNKISYNVSQQTYTDTLGTDVLTVNANTDGTLGWYDVNGGYPTESQTLTDSTLKTSFGCSGKPDYPATDGAYLTTAIAFPDGTSLGLAWEPNEVTSADYTGRLATITMRNGSSTIAYNYNPSSGANYGLNCTYLIPNQITRTTSDGVTTYSWMATNTVGSNYASTTTVVDNGGNKSIYVFTGLTATGDAAPPVTQALTQVYHYQGSSTLLTTDIYCYNAASGQPGNCGTAVVSLPITEVDVYHTIYGMSTSSRTQTKYDKYGNVTYSAQYDFGASSPTVATTTTYGSWNGSNHCYSFSSTINNRPCQVLTTQNGNTVAESRFTYDSYGNLLTTYVWNGSSFLSNSTQNSYNSNGTIATSYDLAGNITTYTYSSGSYTSCGSCTNFPFPTSVSKGGLTTYSTWNGTGGVKLTDIDANNDSTTYGYASCSGNTADPLWRLMSVTDPLGNEACKTYPSGSSPVTISSSSSFNSGNSVQNTTTTADGYGRKINVQQQQGPLATTYDTLTTAYGWSTNYRTVATSQPCSATAAGSCTLAHTNYLDPLGRLYKETTTSNETLTNTYTQNDVLSALTPAPSGENPKQVQKQYDGLGRLTASCKIESSGGTSCGQKTGSASGVVTTTMYSSATGSQTVSTTRGSQTRSKTVDGLGRVTQKMTPEGGTWNYYYDSYSSCPTGYQGASGQLAAVKDPNGNLLCYAHDSLGRVTGVNANGTTCRHFYYDNSTGYSGSIPSGVSTPTNPYGRMVEAATDACSAGTLITDEWFSYDKDGHATDMWESTPHSGMYYHSVATFAGNGVLTSLKFANVTPTETSTYGLDGEGRPSTLITYNQTIVAGTTFNAASQPLDIDIGTGTDEDQYQYDPNTGRMTNWTFDVGTKNEAATLTWNPNGTLQQLAITDGFNSGGTQTCSYNPSLVSGTGYDDIGRLIGVSCGPSGSIWAQTFSYDQYDNITKYGSISWTPGYNSANNQYTLGGTSYDSNGNLLNDTYHQYMWNEFSKLKTVDSSACGTNGECVTYDALGHAVEISNGTAYTEIWYTQLGKTAYLNGSTFSYAYWPTPGGGTLLQTPGYDYYFQHKDWLGSARISSNLNNGIIDDRAFAPYGEMYQNFGSTSANELNFTGDTQDIVTGTYETPNRELNPNQGRWISPDPAGEGWNQYAYATNANSFIDPTGTIDCSSPDNYYNVLCNGPGGGGAGGAGPVVYGDGFGDCGCGVGILSSIPSMVAALQSSEAAYVAYVNSVPLYNPPPPSGTVGADSGSNVPPAPDISGLASDPSQVAAFTALAASLDPGVLGPGDPASVQITMFLASYSGPDGDDSGNFILQGLAPDTQLAINGWLETVIGGDGLPAQGDFTLFEHMTEVAWSGLTSPTLDGPPWVQNLNMFGGNFVDNIGVTDPGGTFLNIVQQNFSVTLSNGTSYYLPTVFIQSTLYQNGGLVYAFPQRAP